MDRAYSIEPAREEDLFRLQEIEREAGTRFRGTGVPESVFADVTSPAQFRAARRVGLLWTARRDDQPVGFAMVELEGEWAHLEEVDVLPSHGRRGIGAALVREVCSWARSEGLPALTLTTYRAIPWNAPFYAQLGFREVEPEDLAPELIELVREEAQRGLDPEERVVMRLDLRA